MDYPRLGGRRSRARLALPQNTASWIAVGRRGIAVRRLRATRAQSGRSRISQTQRSEDLELVFICLRHYVSWFAGGGATVRAGP